MIPALSSSATSHLTPMHRASPRTVQLNFTLQLERCFFQSFSFHSCSIISIRQIILVTELSLTPQSFSIVLLQVTTFKWPWKPIVAYLLRTNSVLIIFTPLHHLCTHLWKFGHLIEFTRTPLPHTPHEHEARWMNPSNESIDVGPQKYKHRCMNACIESFDVWMSPMNVWMHECRQWMPRWIYAGNKCMNVLN